MILGDDGFWLVCYNDFEVSARAEVIDSIELRNLTTHLSSVLVRQHIKQR